MNFLTPRATSKAAENTLAPAPDRRRGIRTGLAAALAGITLATATACVTNEELGNPEGWQEILPATQPELAALVPENIRSKGYFSIGTFPPYAPNEFKDSDGKIIGFEIDLIKAAGSLLGLEVDVRQQDFALILPSITAGSLDVGASAFTDTEERQKSYDFVDYYQAGMAWATQPGREHSIDPDNGCGLKVAVQKGTYSDTDEIPAKSQACEDAGKEPIHKLVYDRADGAATATILKKADAYSSDSPVIDFAVARSDNKLVPIGEPFESAPFGWAVAKGSPMGPALLAALQHLIDTGDYARILKPWGLEKGAVTGAAMNLEQPAPPTPPAS